jgi:hypothetical protein
MRSVVRLSWVRARETVVLTSMAAAAVLAVSGCGKTDTGVLVGPRWDPPTAANGFHPLEAAVSEEARCEARFGRAKDR